MTMLHYVCIDSGFESNIYYTNDEFEREEYFEENGYDEFLPRTREEALVFISEDTNDHFEIIEECNDWY